MRGEVGARDQILEYIRAVPHSPTVREIGEHVGKSGSTVFHHLDALEKEGLVVRLGVERRIYPAERVLPHPPDHRTPRTAGLRRLGGRVRRSGGTPSG